jgi:hypothetical protein
MLVDSDVRRIEEDVFEIVGLQAPVEGGVRAFETESGFDPKPSRFRSAVSFKLFENRPPFVELILVKFGKPFRGLMIAEWNVGPKIGESSLYGRIS